MVIEMDVLQKHVLILQYSLFIDKTQNLVVVWNKIMQVIDWFIDQAAASVLFGLLSPDLESVKGFTYINNCFPTR